MLARIKKILNDYFWKVETQVGNHIKCLETEPPVPLATSSDKIFDPNAIALFSNSQSLLANATIYCLDYPSVIEPTYSYSIVGFNKIMRGSMPFVEAKPSLNRYLSYKLFNKGNKIIVDTAVLFDGSVGINYFHFFTDIFNKLWVLEKHGFDKTTPLIIGKKIFNTRYFQYLYTRPEVNQWNWLVQGENDFISCNKIYFIKPPAYNKAMWEKTIALTDTIKSTLPPFRRLFVTRPPGNNRTLTNIQTLLPILNKHGFEIVDPGSKSFEEQVKLFSEATIVAGLHGAGLTNMMFALAKQLRVMEIMPSKRTSGQLYLLALMLGVEYYDCILGSDLIDQKFEIDVAVFEKAIERLVKAEQ